MPLSVALIARDAAAQLGHCLANVAQKRFAVEAVSHDWVLWVGAGDRVSRESVHLTCGTKQ